MHSPVFGAHRQGPGTAVACTMQQASSSCLTATYVAMRRLSVDSWRLPVLAACAVYGWEHHSTNRSLACICYLLHLAIKVSYSRGAYKALSEVLLATFTRSWPEPRGQGGPRRSEYRGCLLYTSPSPRDAHEA
eukprot:1874854-Prymnesium_polylepis.1